MNILAVLDSELSFRSKVDQDIIPITKNIEIQDFTPYLLAKQLAVLTAPLSRLRPEYTHTTTGFKGGISHFFALSEKVVEIHQHYDPFLQSFASSYFIVPSYHAIRLPRL